MGGKIIKMIKATLKSHCIGLALVFLCACGSSPKPVKAPVINDNFEQEAEPVLVEDPHYYLQQARQSFALSNDVFERNQWILRAAEAYKQQFQCGKSKTIIELTLAEMDDPRQANHARLILAECVTLQPQVDFTLLATMLERLQGNYGFAKRISQLQVSLLVHQKQWLAAAKNIVLNNPDAQSAPLDIWYLLQHLSEKELELARLREPALQPWLQLSLITQRFGLDVPQLQQSVTQWQQRFEQHPLSQNLPPELQAALQLKSTQLSSVAVLLPLSGRLAQQGLAIKEGILAAYFGQQKMLTNNDSPAPKLHFFDTQQSDVKTLAENTSEYDLVIGPLMKDSLGEFLMRTPNSISVIALNRLDNQAESTKPEAKMASVLSPSSNTPMTTDTPESALPEVTNQPRVFFALSPEDEAIQLAENVKRKGAQYPIIVAQESGASKRMADAFLSHWQTLSDEQARPPSLATFKDNESMRNSVTGLLDVAQSKSRIEQIEYLTSEQIYGVPRNRRDVDAIVIFATPEQTELLNPIIESSLSPFNDKALPVYASSRSYSLNLSNNSLRDLRNLTFTDMPWMLPDHPWQDLAQQVSNIWPEQDDTLRRLFALGFDAYQLSPVVSNLQTLPQLSMQGLTGKLRLDQSGNIVRQLPLGQIGDNKVNRLELD